MSWKYWCDARNLPPGNSRSLSDAIADRGYDRKKGAKGVRGFKRLALKVTQENRDER